LSKEKLITHCGKALLMIKTNDNPSSEDKIKETKINKFVKVV